MPGPRDSDPKIVYTAVDNTRCLTRGIGSDQPRGSTSPPSRSSPGPGRRPAPSAARRPGDDLRGQLRSPASVRFASFDAFAPILTPSRPPRSAGPARPPRRPPAPRKTAPPSARPASKPASGTGRWSRDRARASPARHPERHTSSRHRSSIARDDTPPADRNTPARPAASPGHTAAGLFFTRVLTAGTSRAVSSGVATASTVSITSRTTWSSGTQSEHIHGQKGRAHPGPPG